MKVSKEKTQLEQVMAALDKCGAQYMKADVKAKDEQENKQVETVVLMLGAVFMKSTGRYMFACPVANPSPT